MDAGDEGCILSITEKVFSVRSAHEPSSRWQAAQDLRSHARVKALTHADHGVGHLLLSLINARQGEHLLHMWG